MRPRVVVAHLDVSPRRHGAHSPQETDQGTTTRSPIATPRTASPISTTSATPSWPIANGPANGAAPQMWPTAGSIAPAFRPTCIARVTCRWIGSASPSQRLTTIGRTIASVAACSTGSGRSIHASRPAAMRFSSCTMHVSIHRTR